ncbi:hypothetical protein [Streptomyces sp. CBG9]|uniref:hypothetical protein n=1 Tax=Streptomyces sp. CBG9 TaxID=2762622 RepID=UPI001644CDF5|nr:hypothetical protein [Streptomyces sp. CBG9]
MPSNPTTLFDHLVAAGTPESGTRLHLADGTFLLVQASPGADAVEVFLYAGLTAPDTNAWTPDDLWEHLMTGGTPGDVIYRDVPVSAVRELILQHGGEHPDQDVTPTRPSPNRQEQWAPDLAATITDLRGRLADGFSEYDVQEVFGRIEDKGGPVLACMWEYVDQDGFGGTTQFLYEDPDGGFFELSPTFTGWLGGSEATPGPAESWLGEPADTFAIAFSDHTHNYALNDRTAGAVLLAALDEYNIKTMTGDAGLSLAIPLNNTTPLHEMFNQRHLLVASHGPSIDHAPENHTGWIAQIHDALGHPVGDPIHTAGDGTAPIDCTADSAAAAAAIAALRAAAPATN